MKPLLSLLVLVFFIPLLVSAQMTYSSSTVTQNTNKVLAGGVNQQVIGLQVVTQNSGTALTMSKFTLSTTGTTNVADIANARIYYTGTNSAFATTNLFGSVVAAPNGALTITGTQVLSLGTNYFWLTYDIKGQAPAGNLIDATWTSINLGSSRVASSNQTPSITDPAGARQIDVPRWVGGVSTDWHTAGNWSNSLVPTSSSDIVIPANATRQPVIAAGTAVARNITVDQAASLTLNGGTFTVESSLNLNGTLNNNSSNSNVNVKGSLTLNNLGNNTAATLNNMGTLQVTGATIVNEGKIVNKGTMQVGTNITVNSGANNNSLTNEGTVKVAANFTSASNVSIKNIGTMEVTGNLSTSSTFLNNGLDGVGRLVVQGDFVNNLNGRFTNLLGMATIKNFYNKALIDGDLGSFAISGISDNATNAVIRGGVDICDSSLATGSKFVDTNNGLIEWGTYDTSAEDGTVTQCGGQLTALPVSIVYFKATLRQDQAELNWQTATERNSASFIVERSVDGKNFTKIGVVQAAGTSNQSRSYTYKDLTTPIGVAYYRLKQIDLDDSYSYTPIITVDKQAAMFNLHVFPNPLSNQDELQIWLSGNAQQHYLLEVLDLQGRLVYQQQVQLKNNIQELFIPTRLTANIKGLCLIRCTSLTSNYVQTIKVIIN